MPYRSKSQVRACFAKNDPNWDCHQWAKETKNIKKLPEKIKKTAELKIITSFQKIAMGLFDPKNYGPIPQSILMNKAIQDEKDKKMNGMSPVEYRNELTRRRTGIVQKNIESAKAV